MADKITIKAEKRENSGKGYARRLRVDGKVPVNVYGGGIDNVSAAVDLREIAAILRTESGANTVFSLDVEGVGAADVIFQDRQIDPLKGRLLHADLRRLAKGEKIEVTVPLHFIGEPVGVKEDGGVLDQQIREIKILCDARKIPEFFEVNVESLGLNESLHISDIDFGEGVEVHESPETMVASVVFIKEEELEPATEEAGEPEIVGQEEEPTEGGDVEKSGE
ncbi:MAG: 50S ribosomal protein L25 [Pyrinomonadaceae bacterium]